MKQLPAWLVSSVLAVTILVSLIGNVIGYRTVHKAFDKYNDSRLDPLGEHAWQLRSIAHGYRSVVLLGDSHARNWDYEGDDELNLGIPSQTSTQIRLRSDSYRNSLTGKRLIVIAGGNDIKSISTNTDRKDAIVRACLASLDAIVTNHQANFGEIVLVTVPPAFSIPLEYRILHSPVIDDAHQEINQGIRELAAKRGVRLLDAHEILRKRMGNGSLSTDGIHLNATAYRYLESVLSDSQ